jgi:hypothetical protein
MFLCCLCGVYPELDSGNAEEAGESNAYKRGISNAKSNAVSTENN